MTIEEILEDYDDLELVSTGNIRNRELEEIFKNNLSTLVILLQNNYYIEINREQTIVHQ